ncbi:arsenate-mycothiol transferase ArsC [Geodermatophilus sp. SYSU D00710]
MSDRPSILFACIHNSGRSVASATLARHYAGDAVEVRSAGSEPASAVNPVVAAVLDEAGLPVTGHTPTTLSYDLVEGADVVVTLGCGESCPVVPGTRIEDWPVEDPKGQDAETVRRIVADLDTRVRELLAEVAPHHRLPPSVLGR